MHEQIAKSYAYQGGVIKSFSDQVLGGGRGSEDGFRIISVLKKISSIVDNACKMTALSLK